MKIKRPNQVWSIDITYIRMAAGFMYSAAIIDWYSKYLPAYKPADSLEMNFCIEALKDALNSYGNPEIINSDQGSQFTSMDFTSTASKNDIKISMDSKGRALDNIAIERFLALLQRVKYLQQSWRLENWNRQSGFYFSRQGGFGSA